MTIFSKLQIRAKVLNCISMLSSISDKSQINDIINELSEIDDRNTIADVILKEHPRLTETEYTYCAFILKQLVPLNYVNEKLMEYIKSPILSDELKYKYAEILKLLDLKESMKDLPVYFNNPEEIIDIETKKLLERATFNPETMLDFLDFISNVSDNDAYLLLDSLSKDYFGDNLVNIIYPILYSDFNTKIKKEVIKIISESKSSLGLKPLEYLLKTTDNDEIKNLCEIGLKKLKFAGASEDKANLYFNNIIKDYEPSGFYTTIPDGSGSQAILITRVNKEERYLLLAIVINDKTGITDCFGFYNISQSEVMKVITKFYKSEGNYNIPQNYAKSKITEAINKTISNKSVFPYEFICWSTMLHDIKELDYTLKEYVNNNCEIKNISDNDAAELLTEKYTLRWFITPEDNEGIKYITSQIYENPASDIKDINNIILSHINDVFSHDEVLKWKEKLYNLIYILKINSYDNEADKFLSIVQSENLFNLFKTIIIQKSIFCHFVKINENIKDMKKSTNIFTRRNSNESKYDSNIIREIIDTLTRNWING